MNIKRAKEEIKDTIEAYLLKDSYGFYEIPSIRQRPIFLIGPPGVGKTQIMEQIARECQVGLVAYTITHHTRQSAVGLPFITGKEYGGKAYSVTEYTMSEIVASIYDKIEITGLKEGILFIDEINCVSETLAPTMLQFLQYKTFGNHKIPDGWVIVTAGNPPEYNKSVRDFDVVTLDRIKLIRVEPDFEVWKAYAYENGLHPAVISYLNARTENFCRIETTVDGKYFATPRGWEDLSKFIQVYEQMGKKADRDVVGEYIQFPRIAKDFANYLELYYKYRDDYQIDEILSGIIRESLCDKLKRSPFDEKLNVIGLLLSRLGQKFREVSDQGDRTGLLMEELKKIKPEAGISSTELPGALSEISPKETPEEEVPEKEVPEKEVPEKEVSKAEVPVKEAPEQKAAREEVPQEEASEKETIEIKSLLTASGPVQRPVSYTMADRLAALRDQWKAQWEKKREAGLLNRREDYLYRDVEALLSKYEKVLRQEDIEDVETAWERIRGLFGEESALYDELLSQGGVSLEHAFDFMEAAFANSQEMVVFITELNSGYYSVKFLKEYDCERYYQYNEQLLFKDREDEIKTRIRSLGK
ncbi:MAG: ATP-binding protein [Lacrimispora sp.]